MVVQSFYDTNCSTSVSVPLPNCNLKMSFINPECHSVVKNTLTEFCKMPFVDHYSDPCCNTLARRLHVCSSTHLNLGQCGETVIIPCSSEGFSALSRQWKSAYPSTDEAAPWCGVAKQITALGLILLLGTGTIARFFIR